MVIGSGPSPLDLVAEAVRRRRFTFEPHGVERLMERGITVADIVEAVGADAPEVIHSYPGTPQGTQLLILGIAMNNRPLHVLVVQSGPSVKTCYEPDLGQWYPGFRKRRA